MQWRIGEWVVCSDTDTVRTADARHKIERRAMEALLVLAERAGQVVKKDELIAAVWGRIAVSDHSVAMVVSQLRRALKDDAKAPRYIETITKRGYRMIAVCERVPDDIRPAAVSRPSVREGRHATRGIALYSGIFAAVGLSAATAFLLWPG